MFLKQITYADEVKQNFAHADAYGFHPFHLKMSADDYRCHKNIYEHPQVEDEFSYENFSLQKKLWKKYRTTTHSIYIFVSA